MCGFREGGCDSRLCPSVGLLLQLLSGCICLWSFPGICLGWCLCFRDLSSVRHSSGESQSFLVRLLCRLSLRCRPRVYYASAPIPRPPDVLFGFLFCFKGTCSLMLDFGGFYCTSSPLHSLPAACSPKAHQRRSSFLPSDFSLCLLPVSQVLHAPAHPAHLLWHAGSFTQWLFGVSHSCLKFCSDSSNILATPVFDACPVSSVFSCVLPP